VEGVRAPLYTIAPGTIQFVVPDDIPPGSASVVVSQNGAMTNSAPVAVEAATPYVLAVVHSSGSLVTQAASIVPGETISLYTTGLGATSSDLPIGAVAPLDSLVTTSATPQVLLSDVPLNVAFSGLAPGFVGLYVINATVPSTFVPGNSPLSIAVTVAGQSTRWQAAQ